VGKNRALPSTLGDLRLGAARTCPPQFILRRAYTTKQGVQVSAGCVPDTGAPGKTPPSRRTLPEIRPGGLRGWKKKMAPRTRHGILRKVVDADGCGEAIRRLNLLRNKTADPGTKRAAGADMNWLRDQAFCELKTKGR